MRVRSFALPFVFALCFGAIFAVPTSAQDTDRAAQERRFEEALNGCRFVGHFTDDAMASDGEFSEDSYTISKVEHLEGDRWRFTAVMEFGKASLPISIEVDVLWAGDTPVITVSDFVVPMMGTYNARVLVRGDRYAGTWSGKTHGGHLFGRIVPLEPQGADVDAAAGAGNGDAGGDSGGGHDPGDLDDGDTSQNWPSFRGPGASGQLFGYRTPSEWDIEVGHNVRFSRPIVGMSHASPVIFGNRIYTLTSTALSGDAAELKVGLYGSIEPVTSDGEQKMELLCHDKRNGKPVWRRTVFEGAPAVPRHPKGSHAASSPATDGEHVVVFLGSEGLHCWNAEGEKLWSKDFGVLDSGYYVVPTAQWGFASSPVIHDGLVLIQVDVQGQSFVAALKVEDGEEVWRTARDEVPTWSTPTVYVQGDRSQVIVNGYKHIGGYDLTTGKELWNLVGGGDIPVPTPIVDSGLIFITNSHGRMAPIFAIDAMAEGTLEISDDEESLLWFTTRRGNYMQTPLLVDGILYCCGDQGVLGAFDAASGEVLYRERLGSGRTGFTSSGVFADDKLYFASEEGEVHVIRAGPTFELLSVNPLGEECMASPAISEGTLYYRTRSGLVALSM